MSAAARVRDRALVAQDVAQARARGGRVVFTCGVFDIVHVGHVRYLEFARSLGDMLVVGVNSDASARRLGKGPGRPFNPQAERAEVVAALSPVDAVCVYDELRPNETIRILRPDIHVKDAAYEGQELPEAEAVRAVGATIVFAPHVEGRSTTRIVERLAKGEQG